MEVKQSNFSVKRLAQFEADSRKLEEKVFSYPEILAPAVFSQSSPIPVLPFDLVPTLHIREEYFNDIYDGFNQIDTLQGINYALDWLLDECVTLSKALNKEFYSAIASHTERINKIIATILPTINWRNIQDWSDTLRYIRRFQFQYGLTQLPEKLLKSLIDEFKEEDSFYLLMIEMSFLFPEEEYIKEIIGRDWLNTFYLELKSKLASISTLIFKSEQKLFDEYLEDSDFDLNAVEEHQVDIINGYQELNVVFQSFLMMKKHAIYTGIIGRLAIPFESLKIIAKTMNT